MRVTHLRAERVQFLVSTEEREMAAAISRATGRTISDVLRSHIREQFASLSVRTQAQTPGLKAM